ncbi:helix-turn-helix domain-containing protein [Alteraurantiacibacter buctensis]|uniref:Helix-turn-helix domain-containing protein n=1 Tax=Alteraurantiacibacter buctensis TaxID=1503981 RepID=A0A844Z234_9SPHN|nr:helix-turn-helix transcriptional regulator [Alteraurantiacibacter buctensis]MXO73051.1 helix-turn-helix domain-containing protein [Alteraurantiacibacter buctensis]
MEIRQRIGWNLRRLRAGREITQEDFATDSGFDRGYISGVERGVRNPSILVLERIATALGVDVVELLDARKANEFAEQRRGGM